MAQILVSNIARTSFLSKQQLLHSSRLFSTASVLRKEPPSQDSTPVWPGRHGKDHAVKRDGLDVQSKEAHQGMQDHAELKEGSDAISRKDESSSNKRAKQDNPEAPEPVIGMNDERGSKGH